jgi:glycosyltransferase involved in cell wall biosynthesis
LTGPRPLRAALHSGLYLAHDAISDSMRHKVDVLDSLSSAASPIELTIFTHATDYPDDRIAIVPSVADVVHSRAFWEADIHLYEFGIYYPLFDSIFLVPDDRLKIAFYHNVTPVDLVDDVLGKAAVSRSLVQKHNLFRFDKIACDSKFNQDDLLSFGIPSGSVSVLHLPPACLAEPQPLIRERSELAPVELLYIGRFVRSKGVLDLVAAIASVRRHGCTDFRLTLVGNVRLSDPEVLFALHNAIADEGLDDHVTILGEASDAELAQRMGAANALVIPSYHEGYCVPVIEAFHAGCHVLGYDSSNLPNVTGGLARLVATGDVQGLASALTEFIAEERTPLRDSDDRIRETDRGPMTQTQWRYAVGEHLARYSYDSFRTHFVDLIRDGIPLSIDAVPTTLASGA